MSIIDRILGRTPAEGPQISAPGKSRAPGAASAISAKAPGVTSAGSSGIAGPAEAPIRVYDQFGRAHAIGREAWRQEILLPNLASSRAKPDALFDLVMNALNEDFAADV